MYNMMTMGMGFTRFGGGSSHLCARIWRIILHCSSTHGVLVGGSAAFAVALGKDLEDGDGVFPGLEEWVDSVFKEILVPALPMLALGFGALKSAPALIFSLTVQG
jgi:hypothetical protein